MLISLASAFVYSSGAACPFSYCCTWKKKSSTKALAPRASWSVQETDCKDTSEICITLSYRQTRILSSSPHCQSSQDSLLCHVWLALLNKFPFFLLLFKKKLNSSWTSCPTTDPENDSRVSETLHAQLYRVWTLLYFGWVAPCQEAKRKDGARSWSICNSAWICGAGKWISAQLLVPPAPFHTQTWLCVRSGWRLPTLAVFQPLETSDVVGNSVMAQREPRTPLCRFRLLSLPYRQKNWGEFFAS